MPSLEDMVLGRLGNLNPEQEEDLQYYYEWHRKTFIEPLEDFWNIVEDIVRLKLIGEM